RMTDAGSVYQQAGNGLIIVYLGLCFGVAAALFLICLHGTPAFSHDVMERFQGNLSDESSRLIGWGLMAVPILVTAPLVWLLAAWAALFYPYFRRREKRLAPRTEEHTSELQSRSDLVCRLLLEKKKTARP